MKACIIIPARFASSRFPGKPLAKLNGKEMILWVAENCARAVNPSDVFIATDNKKISDIVIKQGFKVDIADNFKRGMIDFELRNLNLPHLHYQNYP